MIEIKKPLYIRVYDPNEEYSSAIIDLKKKDIEEWMRRVALAKKLNADEDCFVNISFLDYSPCVLDKLDEELDDRVFEEEAFVGDPISFNENDDSLPRIGWCAQSVTERGVSWEGAVKHMNTIFTTAMIDTKQLEELCRAT